MGYISNQWLNRGAGLRNRSYRPVVVKNSATNPSSPWSVDNKIAVQITAVKPTGQYQTVYLNASEAEQIALPVLKACSSERCQELAATMLGKLSDTELFAILSREFAKRTKQRSQA